MASTSSKGGQPKTPKHLIFLGAGASASSGDPLARDLRFFMSSSSALERDIERLFKSVSTKEEALIRDMKKWLSRSSEALRLLREGCFGTVDEYCYLVRNARAPEVIQLKGLLRLIIGIHRPENEAGEALPHPFVHLRDDKPPPSSSLTYSDYYPFIQRLFKKDLHTLRNDIVVMSFNYDCYLEWLLRRAFARRKQANAASQKDDLGDTAKTYANITSGFSGGLAGLDAIKNGDEFCLLKLHGLVAWPNPRGFLYPPLGPDCSFDQVFNPQFANRLESLTAVDCVQCEVPIVFPWEIIKEDGTFADEREFPIKDAVIQDREEVFRPSGRAPADPDPYGLFKAIWTRARSEVQAASKISVVGLSMHEYLDWGFQYLLQGKEGIIELVVTDKEGSHTLEEFRTTGRLDPFGVPARVHHLLSKICPRLGWDLSVPRRKDGSVGHVTPTPHRLKIVSSFEEFIQKEMG